MMEDQRKIVRNTDTLSNRDAPRFDFVNDLELGDMPDLDWLVDGVLPANSFVGIFGKEGSAKSFFALEIALRIATGTPWLSRNVKQGDVIYVAGEGKLGYKSRVAAWKAENSYDGMAGVHFVSDSIKLTMLRTCRSSSRPSAREVSSRFSSSSTLCNAASQATRIVRVTWAQWWTPWT
jgi:KaiC/GvpD/RAD55 family RecA-like ATPase